MKKKSDLKKAKDKAWSAFSSYIRTRDCIRFTGNPERGICVTCKRSYLNKELQAGHFIAGRTNSVLFDEEAVYSQCYGCNIGRGGAHVEYFIFMEQEHGRDKIDELRLKKTQTLKYKLWDYQELEEKFKTKREELLKSLIQ